MATKKKTPSGAAYVRNSGLLGKASSAIGKSRSESSTSSSKKTSKDTGGKTTASTPKGLQKSKAQGEAEKAALRKKQQERAKKMKGGK